MRVNREKLVDKFEIYVEKLIGFMKKIPCKVLSTAFYPQRRYYRRKSNEAD
jgi:hypothetical protein